MRAASRTPCSRSSCGFDLLQLRQDAEARSHRALGVVLVARESRRGKDPVAEELRDVPLEAFDHPRARLVEGRPTSRQEIFGIAGAGRTDEPTEIQNDHGQVTALGLREPRTAGAAEGGIGRARAATAGAAHRRSAHRLTLSA